jgi:phage-related protein
LWLAVVSVFSVILIENYFVLKKAVLTANLSKCFQAMLLLLFCNLVAVVGMLVSTFVDSLFKLVFVVGELVSTFVDSLLEVVDSLLDVADLVVVVEVEAEAEAVAAPAG